MMNEAQVAALLKSIFTDPLAPEAFSVRCNAQNSRYAALRVMEIRRVNDVYLFITERSPINMQNVEELVLLHDGWTVIKAAAPTPTVFNGDVLAFQMTSVERQTS